MVEAGYPAFDMPGWGGLIATAGTPKDVVDKINAEMQRAVAQPERQKRLITVGMEPPPAYGPAQVRQFIEDDIARWTKFVNEVGLDKLRDGSVPQ
jgi:tripartite-type tricarboxylate transporter receptor subunit TctC